MFEPEMKTTSFDKFKDLFGPFGNMCTTTDFNNNPRMYYSMCCNKRNPSKLRRQRCNVLDPIIEEQQKDSANRIFQKVMEKKELLQKQNRETAENYVRNVEEKKQLFRDIEQNYNTNRNKIKTYDNVRRDSPQAKKNKKNQKKRTKMVTKI